MDESIATGIENWLQKQDAAIPLQAQSKSSQCDEIDRLVRASPSTAGSIVEAMLWLRVGLIDRAHEIVQDGRNENERYLHGIVHRLEGDFWNSKYWFRQVSDRSLLARLSEAIENDPHAGCNSKYSIEWKSVFPDGRFRPERFVDSVEALTSSKIKQVAADNLRSFIELLGYSEWQALWKIALKSD